MGDDQAYAFVALGCPSKVEGVNHASQTISRFNRLDHTAAALRAREVGFRYHGQNLRFVVPGANVRAGFRHAGWSALCLGVVARRIMLDGGFMQPVSDGYVVRPCRIFGLDLGHRIEAVQLVTKPDAQNVESEGLQPSIDLAREKVADHPLEITPRRASRDWTDLLSWREDLTPGKVHHLAIGAASDAREPVGCFIPDQCPSAAVVPRL
jgi:hypothetical protein